MSAGGDLECQHAVLFLQRKEYDPCYWPRRLGADVHSSLVTFVVSVWLEITLDPPTGLCHKLIFVGQSIEPIFVEGAPRPLQRVLL